MTIVNSTISNNAAKNDGGVARNLGTLTIADSTFAYNRADSDANNAGIGGGVDNVGGVATLVNTLLGGNYTGTGSAASDFVGAPIAAGSGYNLIGDAATAGGLVNGVNGNIVGVGVSTVLAPIAADNGGPTQTIALVARSRAIGYGSNALIPAGVVFDQRGLNRAAGTVDIGAFEVQPPRSASIVGRVQGDPTALVAKSNGATAFVTSSWGTWPVATLVDMLVGDFNGDGIEDVAARDSVTGIWYVGISNGASGYVFSRWGQWSVLPWVDVRAVDLDGDGKTDLIGRYSGQWWAATSNGSAFANRLWDSWNPVAAFVDTQFGDLNGDGKADILSRDAGGNWWASISNGTSGSTKYYGAWSVLNWVDVMSADLNGDGKMDVIGRWAETGQWWAGLSINGSMHNQFWTTWSVLNWVDVKLVDLNKDGLTDLIGRIGNNSPGAGDWWASLTIAGGVVTQSFGVWSPVNWVDVQFGDFNGDGKIDVAGRVNGQWWVGLSNGNTFTSTLWATWSPTASWVDVRPGHF